MVNEDKLEIIRTQKDIQKAVSTFRCQGHTIGLVPTMGALHNGHLSLVENSKLNSYITVVSIFVNPTQFNNASDLDKYPRTVEQDLALLEKAGVDYVFLPEINEIYPSPTQLRFDFGELETILEGEFRPGHFNGVGIIVSKLFHIIQPTTAYFGQKDLQQVAVIRRLVKDLSFDIDISVVPTKRENDGLAMSSRNALLQADGLTAAPLLFQSLTFAKDELLKGVNWFEVKNKVSRKFKEEPLAQLEYIELVKTDTMEVVSAIDQTASYSLCIACYIGEVRLIDNISVA